MQSFNTAGLGSFGIPFIEFYQELTLLLQHLHLILIHSLHSSFVSQPVAVSPLVRLWLWLSLAVSG